MADLNNFTPDEQLLIILICNQEALMNKILELLDGSYDDLEKSLGLATGNYLRSLKDDEVRELLDTHRADSIFAKALANKQSRANNN